MREAFNDSTSFLLHGVLAIYILNDHLFRPPLKTLCSSPLDPKICRKEGSSQKLPSHHGNGNHRIFSVRKTGALLNFLCEIEAFQFDVTLTVSPAQPQSLPATIVSVLHPSFSFWLQLWADRGTRLNVRGCSRVRRFFAQIFSCSLVAPS